MESQAMKLLLIDDHTLFLDGLAQVLSYQIKDVEILTADSVEVALELLASHVNIDLALVDLAMPEGDGISFIKQVNASELLVPIAALSASEDVQQIQQTMAAGALGFIPKTHGTQDLISAIECILNGEIYLPEAFEQLLTQHQHTRSRQDIAIEHEITPRQFEVLTLLSQGLANSKIAQILFISEHTVKSHFKQLYQKLQADNRICCINQAKTLSILPSS